MKLCKNDKSSFYALLFPALVEVLLSKVFLLADSMMLGQMSESTVAVAAVGLCNAPINLIICVTSSFCIGTTAMVSWYYGADEKKNMRTAAWQSMAIVFFVATVFTAISLIFARPIMAFVCSDESVLSIATEYYRINAYGFFFQIMTFNVTAILRGIGISKLPMMYNLSAGVVNVALNYLLIFGKLGFPELGASGAAVATVVSKGIAFVIAMVTLVFAKTEINFRLGLNKKLDRAIKTRMLPIGITAAGEQVILQSGGVLSARILAALPTPHIAASQIATNLEAFAWATGSACQAASTSLFGRALGEGSKAKAKAYLSYIVKWALGFSAIEMLAFVIFRVQFAQLFTNDASIYPLISSLLIISGLMLPFVNTHQTVSGALRSAGDSIAPLIASFVSLWVFRVLAGYITVNLLDLGVYAYKACIVADQLVRCAIVTAFYLKGHWERSLIKQKEHTD